MKLPLLLFWQLYPHGSQATSCVVTSGSAVASLKLCRPLGNTRTGIFWTQTVHYVFDGRHSAAAAWLRTGKSPRAAIDGWFPSVPLLCWKLMNFLWLVNCVSHSANAQLGFNDLSVLLNQFLHPALVPLVLSAPYRYSFCLCLPLASCGWCYSYRIISLKSLQAPTNPI